jgi:UDP-GlcNAc3NAcA epimerase
MKMLTVLGARPQFVKGAVLSRELVSCDHGISETIVHTGQHYDSRMSDIFFNELGIPKPKYNLDINGGSHGAMTGRMMESLESVVLEEKPDLLLVYGDTNSTLAGALVAAKCHIPIAHVEAGLRSFNMNMPEEVNRIITDRLSRFLFCPTEQAVLNLEAEAVRHGVHNVGDIMYDAALLFGNELTTDDRLLSSLGLVSKNYVLVTCHRQENTDDFESLKGIFDALNHIANSSLVVFPIHPRTNLIAKKAGLLTNLSSKVKLIEPVSYMDMVSLLKNAEVLITDSGGVQKEAFFYRVPCITMREETEWVETVEIGANSLVGASKERIIASFDEILKGIECDFDQKPYGDGRSAKYIAEYVGAL